MRWIYVSSVGDARCRHSDDQSSKASEDGGDGAVFLGNAAMEWDRFYLNGNRSCDSILSANDIGVEWDRRW